MCGGSETYSHWSGSRFSVWFRDGSKFFKVWMPVFGSKQIKFVFKFCPLQTVQNIWNLPFCFILNAKHPRRVRIRIREKKPGTSPSEDLFFWWSIYSFLWSDNDHHHQEAISLYPVSWRITLWDLSPAFTDKLCVIPTNTVRYTLDVSQIKLSVYTDTWPPPFLKPFSIILIVVWFAVLEKIC